MKRDLYFSKPLMNAAGSLGFAPDPRDFENLGGLQLGAFVTNPISLRPRQPTAQPAVLKYPGGFLLHTGLPNPGIHAALKKYSAKWSRSDLPIIVHLMADRPEETQRMVRELESIENVMAAQLGFAPLLTDDIILMNLEMCLGELPLIFALPHEQVLSLGPRLMEGGASAVSLTPPRGALYNKEGNLITGRMYGPALFPRALDIIRSAAMIGLAVIGSGGVGSDAEVESMLKAGAMAVETGTRLWVPKDSND
jgi:dihydroorotate dehydrogenase